MKTEEFGHAYTWSVYKAKYLMQKVCVVELTITTLIICVYMKSDDVWFLIVFPKTLCMYQNGILSNTVYI